MQQLRKRTNLLVWIILGTGIFIGFMYLLKGISMETTVCEISFSEFLELGKQKKLQEISQKGNEVVAKLKQPRNGYTKVKAVFPREYFSDPAAFNEIREFVSPENYHYSHPSTFWTEIVLPLIPWVLLVLLLWFIFARQIRATNPNQIFSFAKISIKYPKDKDKVTFDDVAGIDEAKEEVKEIVEFLKNPSKFKKLGARIPKGLLLVGPTGTGKTLLARAIAGEAGVPFLSVCGSDFVEMFVGVGAARVRDLFKKAKENTPCIVFLDEIDSVGRRRGSGLGGGHDEREQTLNAILVEMDGFEITDGLIVLAATNRPDILDPAMLRPGRFDREIYVDLPDVKGREAILKVHARKVKLAPSVDLSVIARTTPLFSGADLAAVINEAAIIATMKSRDAIEQEDLEEARDKVKWGKQKKSKVMDETEKKIIAYHESGHALIACLLPDCDPIHKVTIIPRGPSLGATMTMPEKDRYIMKKSYCLATLTMLYGGRASEEIFLGEISAGAKDDIKKATELIKMMVCEWGMSENLGPLTYTEAEEHLFLGREITKTRTHSDKTIQEIDQEIRKISDYCYNQAKKLILENKSKVEALAKNLLIHETLSNQEVKKILEQASSE